MTATTIIPAPSFFERLLYISSSKPYRYFLKHVVIPIRYRFFGPRDPAQFVAQIEAATVRAVCRETGLDRFPRMLKKPESCPICRESILMMIEPVRVCFACWPEVD